jgi:type I restriction enzyme S subunit
VSWQIKKLGDVCSFMTGGTPKSTVSEYYDSGSIPWIVSGDIHQGEIFDCQKRISNLGQANSNTKFLPENSVLIALNGQGKTRATVALLRMGRATCNQSVVSINPVMSDELASEYLYYYLKSQYIQMRNITGDKDRAGLNIPLLKAIEIPLPPIETQKQIAAVLEKSDQLRKDCKQMEQELNSLAQSVFIDMFGDPVTNPKGWPRHKLGEMLSVNHGYAFKSEFFTMHGDYVLLTPGNFHEKGGYWDRGDKQKFYSGDIPGGYVLEKNDLLLAMTEQAAGLLGSSILIPESNKYLHNQRLGLVKFKNDDQNKVFYAHLFNSKSVRLDIHSMATGTKVRHTSPTKLEAIEVGVPSRELQWDFEVVINSINANLLRNAEAKLEFELSFNSLMQKAFKGELTLKSTKKVA